jgi:hypothetical protein
MLWQAIQWMVAMHEMLHKQSIKRLPTGACVKRNEKYTSGFDLRCSTAGERLHDHVYD